MADRERRPQRTPEHSEELQEQQLQTHELVQSEPTPVHVLADRLQGQIGNGLMMEALSGEGLGGFGDLIAGEMFLAAGGVGESILSSNAAVAEAMAATAGDAVMRHARGGVLDASMVQSLILRSRGVPLPDAVASRFSAAMGHDFSAVRVHTDAAAQEAAERLSAHAFTQGQDIYFGRGEFSPDSRAGEALLGHELTHVQQHDEGRLATPGAGLHVSSPSDATEQEAYAVEGRIHADLAAADVALSMEPGLEAPGADADLALDGPASGPAVDGPAASGPVHRAEDPDVDSKKGDTKTAGEEFERGAIVHIGDKSGPIGVVVEAPMDVDKGDFGVLLIGEDIPRQVAPEELEPFSGKLAESFKPSMEAGGLVKVLVEDEWVDGLILAVFEVVEASPLGEVVRLRAEAYPVEDDQVLLDKPAVAATLAAEPSAEPRYAVGEDVYAQVAQDDWKRARVEDAWRPEDTDTVLITEEGSDGFVYLIVFDEEGDVCRSEEYEADQLHEAEQLGGAGAQDEEVSEEGKEGDQEDGKEQDGGETPDEVAAGGDAVAPDGEPAQETPVAPAPVVASGGGGGASVGPAVPPPAATAPDISGVSLPDLSLPTPTYDKGEKAFVKEQTGLDVDANLQSVQSSIADLKTSAAADLQCSVADIKTSTADSSTVISDASKSYSDASSQLDTAVTTVAASANQGTDAVVSTGQQSVDTAIKTFEGTVTSTTDTARTTLTDQAKGMEEKVKLSEAKYAKAIDAAIEKESAAMKARFEGVIKKLEAEGKKEEEEGRELYKQAGAGGAIKRAQDAAEKIGIAKVKQTYVKGFQKLLKFTLEKLDAQKGAPSTLLAGKLTAPTLEDVWPATKLHESELKKQQERTKKEADDAKKQFGTLTTQEGDKQKKATDEVTDKTQKTTDAVNKDLADTTANVQAQGDAQNKIVNQKLTEQEQKEFEALKAMLDAKRDAPDATLWGKYLQEYQADLAADAKAIKDAAATQTAKRGEDAKKKTDETKTALKTKVDAQNASLQADNQKFADSVAEGVKGTQGNIQSMETGLKDSTAKVSTSAKTRQDEATTKLDADAQAFVDNKVVAGMQPYIKSADEQFGKLSKKMEEDLKGAGKKAISREDADRDKRSSQCRKAAEHTWGTDETLYMEGVSGLTPTQGYALQVEYEHDWSEGLQWRIRDETSGSLMKSLLAWTTGDETEAVKMAMKYAASESLWGPDTEVADKALRGLSDEGRKKLSTDPDFNKSRNQMLINCQMDWPFTDSHDKDAIAVLSDMSKTKEDAELTADAIQLHDKFDGLGTEENEAFKILEKRDGEGNAKLAEAYAKYVYERENQGMKWSDLPEKERKRLASGKLKGDISSEFEYDANEDRGLALLSGNKGLARAAQLKQSAVGLNDTDEALAAMKNDKMFGGDTWMDRVDATQEQADFVAGMNQYKSGGRLDEDFRNKTNSQEGKKANADIKTFEQNKHATSQWLTDEFGEKGASNKLTGNDDRDVIANNMLHTALDTGTAGETDTFAYGVDKLGTEEAKVKAALEGIAGIADTNTRLAKLNDLGGYCAGFISKRAQDPDMQAAQRRAGKAMAKLPGYIQKLEESTNATHKALGGNIRNIMIALDYETDGGEQFDFELLVVKATVREDNVSDRWHYAEQKFLAHIGASDLNSLRKDPDVIKVQNQSIEDIAKDIDARRQRDDGSQYGQENLGGEHKKLVAAQLLRVEKLYNEGQGKWFDSEGWVIKTDGKIPPENQTKLDEFDRQIKKLENAADDYEADKNSLVNIITTVVSIVAGVLITALSFGAGSVAAAGLIAAAVTLAAGTINIVVKQVVLGDRYGADAFMTDIASMVADAILNVVTMGMGKFKGIGAALEGWVGQAAGKMKALRILISEAAQALPGEVKNLLFNEQLWDSGKFDKMFQDFFLGMMSSVAGGLTGQGAEKLLLSAKNVRESSKKLLAMFADNMTSLLANPNSWNENLGWQVLQTLGTTALGGTLGKGLLSVQVGRFNAKTTLTDADWQNVANLPADIRATFFKDISATHKADLKSKAAAGSELHAGILKDSGLTVTPDPVTTEPVNPSETAKSNKADNDAQPDASSPVKTPDDATTNPAVKTDNQSGDGGNIDPNKSAADAAKTDSRTDTKSISDSDQSTSDKTAPVKTGPSDTVKTDGVKTDGVKTDGKTAGDTEPVKTKSTFESEYDQAVKSGYGKGASEAKQAEMKATFLQKRAEGKKLTAPPNPRWATPRSDAEWSQYHADAAAGMTDSYTQYKKQIDAGKSFDATSRSWVDPKTSNAPPAFDPNATQVIDISKLNLGDPDKTMSGFDPDKTQPMPAFDPNKTQPMPVPPHLRDTQPMPAVKPADLDKTQPMPAVKPSDLDKTQPMAVPPHLRDTQPMPAVKPDQLQPASNIKDGDPVQYKGKDGYTVGFRDGDHVYISDPSGQILRVPATDIAPGSKVAVPTTGKTPDVAKTPDPVKTPGTDNADTVDTAYTNRSGTQRLVVDPDSDPKLQAAIDQANQKIAQGKTPAEKLALLVDHVHNGIKYDMAAQQGMYQKTAGSTVAEAKLGDMLAAGAVVCREKAIFTHQMLAEMGIPSQVVTGNVTVNGPDGVKSYGHAWVKLADGTIVDGTWGKVYPGGKGYPVDSVVKDQTFARPKTSLEPDAIDGASKQASKTLTDPAALSALNKQAATTTPDKSPAERLLQPGTTVKLPEKRGGILGWLGMKKKATVSRVERDMVFIISSDGSEVMIPRADILKANGIAETTAKGLTNADKVDTDSHEDDSHRALTGKDGGVDKHTDKTPSPSVFDKFSDKKVHTVKTGGMEEQADFLAANIPGLSKEQAMRILQAAHSRGSTAVFGGSRLRGDHQEGSDIDVGWGGLSERQAQRVIKGLNKGNGETDLSLEELPIVTGKSTPTIDPIKSPEEFFQRSGTRAGGDKKAGQPYVPSGSITCHPDGTIEITPPGAELT